MNDIGRIRNSSYFVSLPLATLPSAGHIRLLDLSSRGDGGRRAGVAAVGIDDGDGVARTLGQGLMDFEMTRVAVVNGRGRQVRSCHS